MKTIVAIGPPAGKWLLITPLAIALVKAQAAWWFASVQIRVWQ
jgi:hypothetical protein